MSTASLKAAITGKVENPFDKLRIQIAQRKNDLQQLLGPKTDRFIQITLNAIAHRPELLDADRQSLFIACRQAAQDGLYPDGKEAVFNVYNTKVKDKESGHERWIRKVQYLPMVRGLIKLIWETEQFTMVDAAAVYARDFFEFRRGEDPRIEHLPYAGTEDPGEIVAAYFVGKMKSGEVKREVMFRRDIERARASSKTADRGPWVEWYDQMAIKSVIHRVYKQLPSVPEVDAVIERDVHAAIADLTGPDMLDFGQQQIPAPDDTLDAPGVTIPERAPEEVVYEQTPVRPTEAAQVASPPPARGKVAKPPVERDPEPSGKAGPGLMTVVDALAMVDRGAFADALDLARGIGPEALAQVQAAVRQKADKPV
jgi:recombination protein RecT